jgi:hypothetical protein
MTRLKLKTIMILMLLIYSISDVNAQTGFDDDVDDVGAPAAPINDYLLLATCAAVWLGYKKLNKTEKSTL